MEEEKINISSIDFNSIVQLRRALHRIGVNSSTPGLTGTKRMRELGNRLRAAISNEKEEEEEEEDFGEWNNKSMMELRQELIRRGIDTSTHGVTGHDRRRCLMKRLQSSRKEIRPAPSIGLWRKTTTTKEDDLILDTVKKVSYNDDESSSSLESCELDAFFFFVFKELPNLESKGISNASAPVLVTSVMNKFLGPFGSQTHARR